MSFETERLIIRALEERDAPDLHPTMNDPEVTANLLLPHPFPEDLMIPWIRERREAQEQGERYMFAIVLKETNRAIGVCGLVGVSWEHMHGEVIYWLGKPYWGAGYMTEAAAGLVRFAFEDLGFERVSVGCFTRNTASVRVIEKLGFKYEGCARHEFLKEDKYQDVHHYGMTRGDYEAMVHG